MLQALHGSGAPEVEVVRPGAGLRLGWVPAGPRGAIWNAMAVIFWGAVLPQSLCFQGPDLPKNSSCPQGSSAPRIDQY